MNEKPDTNITPAKGPQQDLGVTAGVGFELNKNI